MHAHLTSGNTNAAFSAGAFGIVGTEHAPHLKLGRHDHESATMVIVRGGSFEETVGGRTFRCVPGTILIKPAGAHHSNAYDATGSSALLVAVPHDRAIANVICFQKAAAMRRLSFEFDHRDAASAIACEGILFELIDNEAAPPRPQGQPPQWLRIVEERIRCGGPTAITALAVDAGRDPVHLAREFRRYFGSSPGEYLRSVKIERACAWLRGGDRPLSAIAVDAGFYDQSHFTNVFRRIVRMTPAEYRRRAHESSKTARVRRA